MVMEDKEFELQDIKDYDRAVKITGYGPFHYELLAVCALSIICVGFQNGLSSYAFPAAQCELGLNSMEIGYLNSAFMIGGILCCFLWGILADNLGRKKVMYFAHFMGGLVTITSALLPSFANLLVCRFLNGFLIGSPGSIIFTYIAEFQPPKYRSPVVCSTGVFLTLSWIFLPLLAYVILPIKGLTHNLEGIIIFAPWRLFIILLAIPELLTGLWLLRMPESPKFFLAKGNHTECLTILRKMYSRNTGNHPDEFPVKNLIGVVKVETHMTDRVVCRGKTMRIIKSMGDQIKSLFMMPLLVVTGLTCTIMFTNMFGLFGLGLWLPEIFVRFDNFEKNFPNASPSISELSKQALTKNIACEATFDAAVTINTVIIATSSLVFNVICGIIATKVHFKVVPLVAMLIGGASSTSIYFLRSSIQNLVVASLFQASMMTANITIGSIAVELFPTNVVAISLCLIMCSGRLGAMASSFLFGLYMDSQCEIPIFVVGAVVLFGGLLCFMVPRRSHPIRTRTLSTTQDIEIAVLSGHEVKIR